MDPQQQLYGLMALAKEQQEAAQKAIHGMQAEREALAKERQALAAMAEDVSQKTRSAAGNAIRATLAEVASEAETALKRSLKPITDDVMGDLKQAVQRAGQAERSMAKSAQTIAWKWAALAGGALAGVVLISYLAMAWQLYQVRSARAEREALAAEIVTLRAGLAELERQGARIEVSRCGEGAAARLCVRAASNQGDGVRNWRGPWGNDRAHYVIPHGY